MHKYLKQLLPILLTIVPNIISPVYSREEIPKFVPVFQAFEVKDKVLLGIELKLPVGWMFYAPAPKGYKQQGFAPEISIDSAHSQLLWPDAQKLKTPLGNAIGYTGVVKIPCKVVPNHKTANRLEGKFRALVCKELCVPIDQDFNIGIQQESLIAKDWIKLAAQSRSTAPELKGFLTTFLILSFLGGILLNVMPCVLPVLALKIVSISKTGLHRKSLYAVFAGIMFSFLILAIILITLRAIGEEIGWGIHFQSPIFVGFMAIFMVIFANNLMGHFEINIFNSLSNRLYISLQKKRGFITDFGMGMLATLLATPCTAPFLGTAVGFAISQDPQTILLIFIAMGLGFSLPYILLTMVPRKFHIVPKPGQWMVQIKQLCAILLFLTAGWLIWVLLALTNFETAASLATIAILFTLYLARSRRRWLVAISTVALIITSLTPRLSDSSNIVWHEFDEQQITRKLAQGRSVFVDITAKWCVSCQANKIRVLNTADITDLFYTKDIYLMRADWTSHNDKITKFIRKHKRAGIPLNILFTPENTQGYIFSEILSKDKLKMHLEATN